VSAYDPDSMSLARLLTRPRELRARLSAARADLRATRARAEEIAETLARLAASVEERFAAVGDAVDELGRSEAALRQELAAAHDRTMHALRIVRDGDAAARAALWELRDGSEYQRAFEEDEPLVTVLISTYRNWELLRDRALPSVLAQTYERWEAIVVGDDAPDDARKVVASFGDDRLRFVNLPYRGPYPADPREAWQVSGTTPWNTGLALASGRWIASNGDDDALRPGCIESLLAHAREQRSEVSYGRIQEHEPGSSGRQLGVFPPAHAQWNLQSSLLHAGLRFMSMQPTDWIFDIPNDWSLAERMLRIGVRFSMLDKVVVDYYPSSLWSGQEGRRS
jgi:Glycosyl transferase family 2